MKIKSITFYKTHLDTSYKNVIDGGRDKFTKEKLKNKVFDAYYKPFAIYNTSGSVKSAKQIDGFVNITIAKECDEIMNDNYNYCIVDTGTKLLFYFIVGMESLNDGNKPSMKVTLKRDAWNNNIEFFTSDVHDDINDIERCHQVRWYGDTNGVKPYYYNSDDGCNFTKIITEDPLNIGGDGNVIWCGVRFSRDCIMQGNILSNVTELLLSANIPIAAAVNVSMSMAAGNDFLTSLRLCADTESKVNDIIDRVKWKTIGDLNMFGGSIFEASAPVFYFPVAIVKNLEDGTPNFIYKFSMNGSFNFDYSSAATVMSVFSFEAEEILDAFLTLIPPFPYAVSGTSIRADNCIINNVPIRDTNGMKYIFPACDLASGAIPPGFGYITACSAGSSHKDIRYNYTTRVSNIIPSTTDGKKLFDPFASVDDVMMLDPRLYCEPYYSADIKIGETVQHIPIIFDRTNIKMVIALANKTEPNVSVFLNDMLISAYTNIGITGKLPTSYDKWKNVALSQMMTLGSAAISNINPLHSVTTNKQGQNITGAHDVTKVSNKKGADVVDWQKFYSDKTNTYNQTATRTYGGGFNTGGLASAAVQGVAKGLEIMGTATTPNVPSMLSNNNIEKQIPRVVTQKWSNAREMEDLASMLHLYGYTHNVCRSVRDNCRVWFDFCRTNNCNLSSLTNYLDRNDIENAFNRGITKWHAELSGFGFQYDFNRKLNNIEREFVSTVDSPYYFDFTDEETPLENKGTLGRNIVMKKRFEQTEYTLDKNGLTTKSGYYCSMVPSQQYNEIVGGDKKYCSTILLKLKGFDTIDGIFFNIATYHGGISLSKTGNSISCSGYSQHGDIILGSVEDIIDKTICISVYYKDNQGYYAVYIDGVLIGNSRYSGTNWDMPSPFFMGKNGDYGDYLGCTISKLSAYYEKDRTTYWTAEEASKHLL